MAPSAACENRECQKKHRELEHIIATLSTHSLKVVAKHEELLQNFKKNQEQYNKLKKKFVEKGEQIKEARKVLGPISMELKALREKYNVAVNCQAEAEHFATKVNTENKNLRRQSQMLLQNIGNLNVTEINFEDEEDDKNEEEYIDSLREKVIALENDKVTLDAEVKEMKEDLTILEDKHARAKEWIETYKLELQVAKTTISRQEKTLALLAKTSEAAFDEHEQLQANFEKEHKTRNAAEKYAYKMCREQEQARRESAMLLKDIGPNHKLMEAMMEIQRLNDEALKNSTDNEEKISRLEEELSSYKSDFCVENIEKEKEDLENQRDSVLEKFALAEQEIELLKQNNQSLLTKYSVLEKRYEDAVRIPVPPPPPPPPPLVIQAPRSLGFLSRLKGKKSSKDQAQKLEKGGVTVNNDYSKAIEEMMSRIRSGNSGLRQTSKKAESTPKVDEPSAMNELQGLLTKMKKSRSEDDLLSIDDSSFDEETELQKKFRRIAEANRNKQTAQKAPERHPPPVAPRRKPSIIPEEDEND